MKCRSVRKLLGEYVFGTLSARREGKVRGHLATCSACEEALTETRFVHEAIEAWPDVPLPEDGHHRLSSRLDFAPPPAIPLRPRRFRHLVAPYVAGLATAASIMLLAANPWTRPEPAPRSVTTDGPRAESLELLAGESVLTPVGPVRFVNRAGQVFEIDPATWDRLDERTRRELVPDYRGRRDDDATPRMVDYETR